MVLARLTFFCMCLYVGYSNIFFYLATQLCILSAAAEAADAFELAKARHLFSSTAMGDVPDSGCIPQGAPAWPPALRARRQARDAVSGGWW